jgi:hypothetical protein
MKRRGEPSEGSAPFLKSYGASGRLFQASAQRLRFIFAGGAPERRFPANRYFSFTVMVEAELFLNQPKPRTVVASRDNTAPLPFDV